MFHSRLYFFSTSGLPCDVAAGRGIYDEHTSNNKHNEHPYAGQPNSFTRLRALSVLHNDNIFGPGISGQGGGLRLVCVVGIDSSRLELIALDWS
jgi:hypothetical protein